MRIALFVILSIFIISLLSVLLVDTITGNTSITEHCGSGRTYAFYRTPEEKDAVEYMWRRAGFIPVSYEEAPESFQQSGTDGFLCLRRMNREELAQEHMLERRSVVTIGSSFRMNKT